MALCEFLCAFRDNVPVEVLERQIEMVFGVFLYTENELYGLILFKCYFYVWIV